MTNLTLAHIVANYKIDYEETNKVLDRAQFKLYKRAYDKQDIDSLVDTEKMYLQALKITERYARRYCGEKEYDY